MPIFLLDENVHKPDTIIERCMASGIEVLRVHQLGLNQTDDAIIFQHVLDRGYVLVTANVKDFRAFAIQRIEAGQDFAGAIWLPPNKQRNVEGIIRKIKDVAAVYDSDVVKEWWLD